MNKYDLNFKITVLRYIFVEQNTRNDACKNFNVPPKTLDKWITKYHKGVIDVCTMNTTIDELLSTIPD